MGEYICPNCRGGFPEPDEKVLMAHGSEPEDKITQDICPWCGQELDGSYEGGSFTKTSIVKSEDDDTKSGLGSLFK